jgi:acyl-CoA synthetase (AMP-forming)/AMP-acid ligase II
MNTAVKAPRIGPEVEREARAWLSDPFAHYGMSNNRLHSIPWRDLEEVQLAAMNLRLQERREQIPVLAKLADAQGIRELTSLEQGAALLFEHTVYKSYPISLLVKQRYDQLNQWLNRLTRYDISGVDVSQCKSIDEWLTKLQDETPLDVATSSGTSGTMSFFPKSKNDYRVSARSLRVQLAQPFGREPSQADLHDKIHVLTPLYRAGHSSTGGFAPYLRDEFGHGDESYLHTAFNHKVSSDLLWLGARLRVAAAKGDMSRVEIPPALLARKPELERLQREAPAQQSAFIRKMAVELKGQRVFALGTTHMFYEVAKRGLEEGVRAQFSPDSLLMGGGGAKGMDLPPNVDEILKEFFNVERVRSCYGMTEMNSFSPTCELDRYHFLPWVTVFILDHDTGKPLPRKGVQTGRAAFFDPTADSTWGGIITGDKITIDWDTPCECGRCSVYVTGKIQRFSEITGGDDKITCAATPSAQAEAMDYLTSIQGM